MITTEEFVSELLGSSKMTKNMSLKENKTNFDIFLLPTASISCSYSLPEDEYVS
jgi:hypothetical protein